MIIKNSEIESVKFDNSKIFRTTFDNVVFDDVDFGSSTPASTEFRNSQFSKTNEDSCKVCRSFRKCEFT